MTPSTVLSEIRLDTGNLAVCLAGRTVPLTQTQFRLLERLLSAPGQVFSRSELCAAAIADGAIVLERTIDVHVAAVRRKLGVPDLIETVRGRGYRFRADQVSCPPSDE
jgi:two-component system phosphate regulon response regulator PhoB